MEDGDIFNYVIILHRDPIRYLNGRICLVMEEYINGVIEAVGGDGNLNSVNHFWTAGN